MFLLNLPINKKEQAAIERRRRDEQNRVSRIFNVKYRTIGIDKESLDKQVKEREDRKNLEKQRNNAFDREMIRNDLKSLFIEQENVCRQRQSAKELNEYRRLYQKPEHTREWDLNNPKQWLNLTSVKTNDDDTCLDLKSVQILERKKLEQEKQRKCLDIQILTKKEKLEQERLANRIYDYQQIDLNKQGENFDQFESECRRARNLAIQNYNEILARETELRIDQRRRQDTEEQLADVANAIFSDMLTEDCKQIFDARGHIIVDRWKGMTKDQLNSIRQQQFEQINENQKRNHKKKRFDDIWATYANTVAKNGMILEEQVEKEHCQSCRALASENRKLAQEQQERQKYLHSNVYRSMSTATFYEQFNKVSR